MKTNFFQCLVATVLGAATGLAAPAPSPAVKVAVETPGGAKIRFANPVFDFGKVTAGELVKHNFVFTNVGTTTLEILEVKPGCGCTTAGTWDKTVAPGKTGSIPLQFNSSNFSGKVAKSASVTSNDPEQSNLTLQITGTVWKAIDVTPPMAFFSVSNDSQTNETKIIRIVSNLDQPLTVSDLQCTNPVFRAELKTVQAGKEYEVHVTAVPPFNTRVVSAPITLKTSSPQMPIIYATAYLSVQQAVVVTPMQLSLPSGPLPAASTQNFTIRNNGTNMMALSEVSVNVPDAQVTVQETQPGRFFSLAVKFPAGFQMPSDQTVEVTIKSNHPQFSLIKVPVRALQFPASLTPRVKGQPAQQVASPAGGK